MPATTPTTEPSAQWTDEERRDTILNILEEIAPTNGRKPDLDQQKVIDAGERMRLLLTKPANFLETHRALILKDQS